MADQHACVDNVSGILALEVAVDAEHRVQQNDPTDDEDCSLEISGSEFVPSECLARFHIYGNYLSLGIVQRVGKTVKGCGKNVAPEHDSGEVLLTVGLRNLGFAV